MLDLSPRAVYTTAFFVFWAVIAVGAGTKPRLSAVNAARISTAKLSGTTTDVRNGQAYDFDANLLQLYVTATF